MRLLFTFSGGNGHFQPLTPLARAAHDAGHDVAVTGRPKLVPMIEAAGFTAFGSGTNGITLTEIEPLEELDNDREERSFRNGFAGWMARERAAAVAGICRDWRPDALVCDETDFGAMIAAESLGLPHATVITLAAGSFVRPGLIAGSLDQVRGEYGLGPDPQLTMVSGQATLVPFPAEYRDPAFPLPPNAFHFKPGKATPAVATNQVYLTLGTIFNLESGDLFQRAIQGASAQPVELTVTAGADLDPARLGPQPPNVHLERYVDQAALLPHCAAMISHAGSGSVLGALAHAVPMVLLPMGADQPSNASRCRDLGVAAVLDAVTATPRDISEALHGVLHTPSYRDNALAMATAFASLPGPASAVGLLQNLR